MRSISGLLLFLFLVSFVASCRRSPDNINSKDGAPMVLIQAGYFWMGSDKQPSNWTPDETPRHKVWLDAYWIDENLVTFDQYDKFCEATGRDKARSPFGRGNQPAIDLQWGDADAYCKWARMRLPTEAEWEKAVRGGTNTQFFWGDDPGTAGDYAWTGGPKPVGGKKPNPFGLFDMVGNMPQYCSDWYGDDYYSKSPEKNPQGPVTGAWKVMRGGGSAAYPGQLRSASRNNDGAGTENGNSISYASCRCAKNQ
jgi:formylglycine-generating enzyme